MADYKKLCAELTEFVERLTKHYYQPAGLLIRARAALADEPAVPEGREPAAVTGQPSDEDLNELMYSILWKGSPNPWGRQVARAVLARWGNPVPAVPVPVTERLPEPNTKVLAHYFNDLGNGRTICAIWVPAKSRSDESGDDDFTEYDEEDDKFYWPEGWYEVIENWDELGWVQVYEGEVDYWQPLPEWPAQALPLPEVAGTPAIVTS